MLFDAKFLTLLTFIIINLLIIFVVKTRTSIVISLIISHLIAVLFFSLSISNYNSFKEIVLALIIYSMVILFLVSNYNPIYLASDKVNQIKDSKTFLFLAPIITLVVLVIFLALFFVAKNIEQIAEDFHEKKFAKQEETMKNPMISNSHPVHIAAKKNYFSKDISANQLDESYIKTGMNERKIARLKDKLSDNFLLKHSSDVILVIVAISSSLLILGIKKTEEPK
jgi:hypothetical protein